MIMSKGESLPALREGLTDFDLGNASLFANNHFTARLSESALHHSWK
jgi:hypothetical protein